MKLKILPPYLRIWMNWNIVHFKRRFVKSFFYYGKDFRVNIKMLVRFIFQRLKRILQHLENNFWMKMYLKSKMVWMYQKVIKSHQSHQDHQSKASKFCLKLEFVSISRVINHMTCYNSSALIGGKFIYKKILCKICSPVWML